MSEEYEELPLEIWVETLKPLHDDQFTAEAGVTRKWGVRGRIIAHHNSHGLCYDVLHDDGTEGCYDPDELALCGSEREFIRRREIRYRVKDIWHPIKNKDETPWIYSDHPNFHGSLESFLGWVAMHNGFKLDGIEVEDGMAWKIKPPEKGGYTSPVKFSSTDRYGCGPEGEDDVYTVQEFLSHVDAGSFIDYDGFGYPVRDNMADESVMIEPSTSRATIPLDATHIVWYNR